jgi:hypothetical protein
VAVAVVAAATADAGCARRPLMRLRGADVDAVLVAVLAAVAVAAVVMVVVVVVVMVFATERTERNCAFSLPNRLP